MIWERTDTFQAVGMFSLLAASMCVDWIPAKFALLAAGFVVSGMFLLRGDDVNRN